MVEAKGLEQFVSVPSRGNGFLNEIQDNNFKLTSGQFPSPRGAMGSLINSGSMGASEINWFPSPRGAMGSLMKGDTHDTQGPDGFPSPRGAMGSLMDYCLALQLLSSCFRPLAGQWVP